MGRGLVWIGCQSVCVIMVDIGNDQYVARLILINKLPTSGTELVATTFVQLESQKVSSINESTPINNGIATNNGNGGRAPATETKLLRHAKKGGPERDFKDWCMALVIG